MTTTLFDIHVQYLEDTHEWYAWNDQIDGAHAIGDTAQDAVANLSDLLPTLITLSKRKLPVREGTTQHFSLPISYA